jgi:methyltransferase (TIGR00027 family)
MAMAAPPGGELSAQAPLGDVSDTARWVAYFRALESERSDALFHDAFARRLAGERGRAIAESLPKGPLAWSLAVRTRVFDELILEAVRGSQIGTILNVAAGLDARPYRLPLPADLRWIEVDLPSIISWKAQALRGERPACTLERISLDLANRDQRAEVLARVSADAPRALVVTEGLLVYLDAAEVASLADDLRRFFPTGLWLLESVAPSIVARQRRTWGKTLRSANAEHKFAPVNGLDFYRPHGWIPRETRSLLDEAQRLGREMRVVSWIRRIESLVPALRSVYARRQATFRNAFLCALMTAVPHR